MSIKDLFNNPGSKKIQKTVTSDQLVQNVESEEYVEAKRKEFEQFIPPINFASASNFAKFGSAELYYEKAFERIHQYYPYDGTLAEKVEFHNSSSYLDKYVFDNLYPRTNGYMNFDSSQQQYISVFGGPHTASAGMKDKTLDSTFDNSMVYNESKGRTSAFEFRGDTGVTIEFWMKVGVIATRTIMEVTGALNGAIHLRTLASDKLQIKIGSGSLATADAEVMDDAIGTVDTWNHYAITIQSSSAGLVYKAYKNGQLNKTTTKSGASYNVPTILPTTGGLNMTIGAKSDGSEAISGSFDEFRYWKTARSPEAIFNSWFIPVGGGTNKYDSNINLGLYFKFNEGITGTQSIDKSVLDYSGRINNGTITNYNTNMRNTGSAIREKLSEPEFLDPIIYSSHPDVVSKKAEYKTSGSLADLENPSMLYRYFPAWMQEEDEQNGKQLKYLSQVMGSYFDTLWHQIGFINRIHDNHYISGSNKPLPFAKKLLQDRGFVIPDLFVDASITEKLLNRDDNEVYEKQINEVRNTIYHNIYNNLDGIYKSKGTEKSFRNFFRSIGVGQDIVKLRMYADDSTFVLRNNYENKSYERKYLNFNYEGHFDATLYQTSSLINTNVHIPGDRSYSGSYTMESEIILPRKNRSNEVGYLPFNSLTASVMGFHSTGSIYGHPATDYGLSVYVIKESLDTALDPDDSHKVKFMVSGGFGELTSSFIRYQYENNKWNLALRLRHINYPYGNVTGNLPKDYRLEFYGVEADGNTKRNSFLLTSSMRPEYFTDDKIFYAGAHRTNFTGSSLYNTDIKLGFVRYWHSFLSDAAIDQHAYDSETFGANEPFENDLVNTYPIEIPREKTLALHWAFNDLTSSDSSGELLVSDLSSGSSDSNYGSLSNTIQRYVQGKAEGFSANAQNALDKMYIQTARKRLPDDLMSSDLTTIKTNETEQFFVDDDVSDNFYSFEKSMYGAISDEMMNMFSTALDLNNLIGQPNQKYHHRYNMADFLRDRFYEDVENEPDIEKFTSFYKWIDDSVSLALQQLVPASSRFSEKIGNLIESHVLERNKYVHQIPITTTFESTEGSIRGVSELKYDWKHGHAPFFPSEEQTNVLWQKERKEKSGLSEILRKSKTNHSIQSSGLVRREIGGAARIGNLYATRKFSKVYDFEMISYPTIHGGINFSRQKNIQLFKESIFPAGALGSDGNPQNIITVGVGSGIGLIRGTRNNDNVPRKRQYNTQALVGRLEGNEYGHEIQGDIILPFNIMSGTVHSGYNKKIKDLYVSDAIFTNLHQDVIGRQNEISIQGPFTEAHIGGLQYHHIDLNKYDKSKSVTVSKIVGGTFPTASIQLTASVLKEKLSEGTGSSVTIRDGDGTLITALYSNVFDLFDNQWTNIDDLQFIINNKLNVTTNKISDNFLAITQSVTGSFYNYLLQSSSHGFITASGFGGGTSLSSSTFTRNLDGPDNRPEGWGLVFKDHPSQGDNDGSFGFIGVDYGSPYPYTTFKPATRYREETAKRPINVKNIKTLTGSSKAGNYTNEIQIFSVAPEHQKTWALEAYDDPNVQILPLEISQALPLTTNYQTLMGIAPYEKGNVFGGGQLGNRQPDTGSLVVVTPVSGQNATGSFRVYGPNFFTTSDTISILAKQFGISGSAATYKVNTGSTDRDFWENLTASINANAAVTSTFTTLNYDYDEGLKISGRDFGFMSGNIDPVAREISLGAFTFSAWMSIPASGYAGYNQSLYKESTGKVSSSTSAQASGRIIEMRNANNALLLKTAYSSSDTADFRFDQYALNNFRTDYAGKRVHVVISHNGTINSSSSADFYINGVHQPQITGSSAAGGGGGTQTQNRPVSIVFFNDKIDGTTTTTPSNHNSSGEFIIDEIVMLNQTSSQAYATALYNNGIKVTLSDIYSTIPSSSIMQYYPFNGQSANFAGHRIECLGAAPLDLDVNNRSYSLVSGSEGAVKIRNDVAIFSLTSSAQTASANVALARTGTNFFNLLGMSGGVTPILGDTRNSIDNVITIPRIDLTGSERNINTRFSAPGGPEVQTIGYLDAYSSTYSVHNALPFRNLSVLGSGSGESGTIRVEDHLGLRRGLKTLRGLHMGRFGIDSHHGEITSTSYPSSGSFNKQHRNNSRIVTAVQFDASIRFNETSTETRAGLITAENVYDATSFPPTGGKAFSLWVNFDSLSGVPRIFEFVFDNTTLSITLGYNNSTGKLFFQCRSNAGTLRTDQWSWEPSTNRWYHIFVTFTGDLSTGTQAVAYIDGVSLGAASVTGASSSTTLKQVKKLQIGDSWTANTIYELQGRLSHFVIYKNNNNNASTLYNSGSPLSSGLPDSGDIIDFWLLGNETELNQKSIGSIIDGATAITSISGEKTSINSTSAELPTIAKGVNYVQTELITKDKYDNAFINSPIPRSELQYSWIHAATTGSDGDGLKYDIAYQKIVGYAPRDGILGKKDEFAEAIVFPSASSIYSV